MLFTPFLGGKTDVCEKAELQLPVSQALALFVKVVRKITKHFLDIQKANIGASLPEIASNRVDAQSADVNSGQSKEQDDMEEDDKDDEATKVLKEKQREMIESLDLSKCVYSFDWLKICLI